MHFQGEMVNFSLKNKALRSESVNSVFCYESKNNDILVHTLTIYYDFLEFFLTNVWSDHLNNIRLN